MSDVKPKKRGCLGCLGQLAVLFILICIIAVVSRPKSDSNSTTNQAPPAAVAPETPSSTATPGVSDDEMAQLAAMNAARPTLPGLAAVDVHGNLTTKGFTLKTNYGRIQSEWLCSKDLVYGSLTCDAFGTGPTKLTVVSAIAAAPDIHADAIKADATEFLPYIASLPYEGSSPQEASKWVRDNIGNNVEKTFGPARFSLRSTRAAAFSLEISPAVKTP